MTTIANRGRLWLRRDTIETILDARAWTQEALADEFGLSRVHFNRLLNGRLPLTRRSRRKLMDWAAVPDNAKLINAPEDLWERCAGREE